MEAIEVKGEPPKGTRQREGVREGAGDYETANSGHADKHIIVKPSPPPNLTPHTPELKRTLYVNLSARDECLPV